MTITANLADGRAFTFPDGTDPQVIQSTVKKMLSQQTVDAKPQLQEQPGVSPQPKFDMSGLMGQYKDGTLDPKKTAIVDELNKRGELGDPYTIGTVPETTPDIGAVETAATIGTSMVAEPIAGLAGIAGAVLPGEEDQGKEWVEKTRQALTYSPESEESKEQLQSIGEVIEPVAKVIKDLEEGLGDKAYEVTGSPAIAAAATTIPTIVAELLGVSAGKVITKTAKQIKSARSKGLIAREIKEAAPEIDHLKTTARDLYDEIDNTGAVIKEEAYKNLSDKIKKETSKAGLDPDITPKASKAVKRIDELTGQPVTITELDTLRKVAQNAAKSIEPSEAALGVKIIQNIDDFLDNVNTKHIDIKNKSDAKIIGQKYKTARNLWGRARKSEMLQEAFEKARNQATGFENGVRTQFRSILNNKKKSKYFTNDELKAIKRVVRGGNVENMAKLVGRLGFSEGGAMNIVGASIGAGGGALIFGPAGAVTVPLVGQVSRKLAQRMTKSGAYFADEVIRAGKDAEKITAAYIKNTPKSLRNPQELSELLLRPDIDLSALPVNELTSSAKELATKYRGIIASSISEVKKEQEGEK